MAERDTEDSNVTPLTEEQTDAVIKNLHERGATFFTWEQLQSWISKFGPKTKMKDIQKALDNQKDQEPKL